MLCSLLLLALVHAAMLENDLVSLTISEKGLTQYKDKLTQQTWQLHNDSFLVSGVDDGGKPFSISASAITRPPKISHTSTNVTLSYTNVVDVTYTLQAGWRFVAKDMAISNLKGIVQVLYIACLFPTVTLT